MPWHFLKRIFGRNKKPAVPPSFAAASPHAGSQPLTAPGGVGQYVVLLKSPSFPYRLYLKTPCSSLETLERISAQEWNRLVAAAAQFPRETAEQLVAQARKSGAKDCVFEALPLTLSLLSEDC